MSDESEDEPIAAPPAKPSKTPSWVTLGFVLGALFVWALPREERAPAERPVAAPVPAHISPPQVSTIEAVFTDYGRQAVWENEITEVALWNTETKDYSQCFEVLRSGENYYFRSIPRLTRPVLTHGVKNESPLLFTEPESLRQEWLREQSRESWRAISTAARDPDAKPDATLAKPKVSVTPIPVKPTPTLPAPVKPEDGKP